jgi:uncharacterized protein (DUF1800 family)
MPPLTRKQFFIALQTTSQPDILDPSDDTIFKRYANKSLPVSKKSTSLSLDQYTGNWTEVEIKHLINRTMFGVRQQDINTLSAMTMQESVDLLLSAPAAILNPPLNNYTSAGNQDVTGVPAGETWIDADFGSAGLNFSRAESLKSWWIGQMINQGLSIIEKMLLFWHNHFATQVLVLEDARLSYKHFEKLRIKALGNFKNLVKEVTVDPAMLLYLNGYVNTKNHPDENYARELQELFTLGNNNKNNYNEDDVKSAARVLTGWSINSSVFESYFVPKWHDESDKQFSSFYNNKIITGRTGIDGATETDELINMIFEKSETAHFLCTKLYRFFVYYNITEDIDTHIIKPLSQILIANNFEVKPVLDKLLKSQHFYDGYNIGCYIKTPLDFMVGILRTFSVDMSNVNGVAERYSILKTIHTYAELNGLNLGDPPNVAGWPAYYRSPAYYQCWINSSTFPARMQFSDALLIDGLDTGTNTPIFVDVIKFAEKCPNVADPRLLINWMVTILLGIDIAETQKSSLIGILLSGQVTPSYWTEAWKAYIADPSEMNRNIIQARLRSLLIALLRLPEFHLC